MTDGPDESGRGPEGQAPRKRRRRRRRRGGPGGGGGGGGRGRGPAREAPSEGHGGSDPAIGLEPSKIDASKPADVPMSPEEVAEMRGHLGFLFRHRRNLRLTVNAAEDLLLNGSREPTHRGQCLHLLSKVDLPCIQSALSRLTDAKTKVELLAGVVRFSSDAGVLILYLESLTAEWRSEAAAAFTTSVGRIDFESLSAARMRRVLDLITATFDGHERAQVLFGLLQSESFRRAFDRHSDLPEPLAEVFVPLRALHEVVFEGKPNRFGEDALARGVTVILGAPEGVLRGYPLPIRERLLRWAVRSGDDRQVAQSAADVLLDSLPRRGRIFSSLGLDRAAQFLRRHEDERATHLLVQVRAAHPDFDLPGRWIEALKAPRVGRMARLGSDAATEGGPAGALERGFWLDERRPVWLRVGSAEEAGTFLAEVQVQRDACIAGVVPVLTSGVDENGVPWMAMPAMGERFETGPGRSRPARSEALGLALTGVQILHTLSLFGTRLPDLDPSRFLVTPAPVLADFRGAVRASPEEAGRAHRGVARAWCETVLGMRTGGRPPRELRRLWEDDPELPELVLALASRL